MRSRMAALIGSPFREKDRSLLPKIASVLNIPRMISVGPGHFALPRSGPGVSFQGFSCPTAGGGLGPLTHPNGRHLRFVFLQLKKQAPIQQVEVTATNVMLYLEKVSAETKMRERASDHDRDDL